MPRILDDSTHVPLQAEFPRPMAWLALVAIFGPLLTICRRGNLLPHWWFNPHTDGLFLFPLWILGDLLPLPWMATATAVWLVPLLHRKRIE